MRRGTRAQCCTVGYDEDARDKVNSRGAVELQSLFLLRENEVSAAQEESAGAAGCFLSTCDSVVLNTCVNGF